jgi:hypothetical protein
MGSWCRLHRDPQPGDPSPPTSTAFQTNTQDTTDPQVGWAYVDWGATVPVSNVTITFHTTCAPTRSSTDPNMVTEPKPWMSVLWPPNAAPSPTGT